jgi:uncharacterized peroxidase-related enzyme
MRIPPVSLDAVDAATRASLEAVRRSVGMLPNLYPVLANSPAALAIYQAQTRELGTGVLNRKLREQIALAVAGANGCDYCASAHTLMGKGVGIAADELDANLHGRSGDIRTNVVLAFVRAVLDRRGAVSDAELQALREAGFGDGEIVEILAHVAMNVFTNFTNNVAETAIDFPRVRTDTASARASRTEAA